MIKCLGSFSPSSLLKVCFSVKSTVLVMKDIPIISLRLSVMSGMKDSSFSLVVVNKSVNKLVENYDGRGG